MDQINQLQDFLATLPASKALDVYGDQILKYVAPNIDSSISPNTAYPLMRFHLPCYTLIFYCSVVFFGYLFMRKFSENNVLKPLVALYNLTQVVCCGYLVVETIRTAIQLDYSPICNTFEPTAVDNKMPFLLYLFYLTKGLDLFDTFFFVFHKKDRQITFLHVYHHISIFMVYWVNANVFYSGDIYYTIIANGFVHFVMYGYYFATTLKSVNAKGEGVGALYQVTQALRPHITKLQLIQFVTMMSQAAYILYHSCGSPLFWTKIYFFYILSMFALFMQFFYNAYMKKKNKKDSKKDSKKDGKKDGKKTTEPTRKSKRIQEQSKRSAGAEKDSKKIK